MKTLIRIMTVISFTILTTTGFSSDSLPTNAKIETKLIIKNTLKNSSVEVKKGAFVKVILHGGRKVSGKVTKLSESFIWVGETRCEITKIEKIRVKDLRRMGTVKSIVAGAITGSTAGIWALTGFVKGIGVSLKNEGKNHANSGAKFWGDKIFDGGDEGVELSVKVKTVSI
ncbi:hypothetical protein JYT25_00655 [bacterium AH-315-C20]|nr:hypothetical protein [bacterium AH-315-C20]